MSRTYKRPSGGRGTINRGRHGTIEKSSKPRRMQSPDPKQWSDNDATKNSSKPRKVQSPGPKQRSSGASGAVAKSFKPRSMRSSSPKQWSASLDKLNLDTGLLTLRTSTSKRWSAFLDKLPLEIRLLICKFSSSSILSCDQVLTSLAREVFRLSEKDWRQRSPFPSVLCYSC